VFADGQDFSDFFLIRPKLLVSTRYRLRIGRVVTLASLSGATGD